MYSKYLSTYLETKDLSFLRDMSVEDLPKELLPHSNIRETKESTYVLLFDGLDQLSADDAKQLFAASFAMRSSYVRIIITGTEDIFRSCLKYVNRGLESVSSIDVAANNGSDIERFVQSELRTCKALQGDASEILKIKERVREELPQVVEGNFSDVRQIIERISEAVNSEHEVEDIVRLISPDTLRYRDVATAKLVKELNGSLNTQEIEQLNELLVWTIYARRWIYVDQMRAALFLRTRRTPLRSLEDKVTQKYSMLLHVNADDNYFEMKNYYLEEFFRNSKREIQELERDANDDPRISMTISIDNVKRSQVQRFFWDLSEQIIMDKFEFTKSLTSGQSAKINANRMEAQLTIARRCFDVLLEKPGDETKALVEYALEYIPSHIFSIQKCMVADEPITPAERLRVVEDLAMLLESGDYTRKHLTESFFSCGFWLHEGFDFLALPLWLRSPEDYNKLNRKTLA